MPPFGRIDLTSFNIITAADWYKTDHSRQYPDDLAYMQAYICARGGPFDKLVVCGVSYVCKLLSLYRLQVHHIAEANSVFQSVGVTFDSTKWDELLKCKDGKLPLKICALPDGTMVPPLVPILTVENTEPGFSWLVTYIESWLLSNLLYMTTVATKS